MWVACYSRSRGFSAIVQSCLRGFKTFSRGYFVSPKFFLVGISWVQNFFSWVFRGSKVFLVDISWVQNFSRGYSWVRNFFSWVLSWILNFLVGISWVRNFFLVSISCVQFFFSCGWFRVSKIFSCWLYKRKWQKQKYKNTSQTTYSFLEKCIRRVLHLLNYLLYYTVFICSNCIFRHLFFSVLGSFHS